MAIADILLRIQAHVDLITKGANLTNVEFDNNIIEIYESLKALELYASDPLIERGAGAGSIQHKDTGCVASGDNSLALGSGNTAAKDFSAAIGGQGGITYLERMLAFASVSGHGQNGKLLLYTGTTDATPTLCTIEGAKKLQMRANSSMLIHVKAIGTSGSNMVSAQGYVTAEYDGTDVTLKDDTIAILHDDITIGGIAAVGNLASDVLDFQVTGKDATNIKWSIYLDWVEHLHTV